jgi:hypothetical protein
VSQRNGSRGLAEFPAKVIRPGKKNVTFGQERLGQGFQRAGLDKIGGPGVKIFLRGEPCVQNERFIGTDILQREKDSEREKKMAKHFHFGFSSGQTGTK